MNQRERRLDDAVGAAESGWRRQSHTSAANYERLAVPGIQRPWAERILERLAPLPGARVLDLACGTGIVARLAAERVGGRGLVAGLDISPAMVAVARSQSTASAAPSCWQIGTAAALPYRTALFNGAICAFSLMFIADRAGALAEARRVLAPDGRLIVSVWGAEADNPVDAGLNTVVHRYSGGSAQPSVAHALGYEDELQQLLTAAGFHSVVTESLVGEHRVALDGMLNRVVTSGMDDATRAAARSDWLAILAPYIEGDSICYPGTALLATAEA